MVGLQDLWNKIMRTNHRIRRFSSDDRGASAVEFAMIAPVMVIMLTGLLDYALAALHRMELESAARSGAQYAMIDSSDTSVIETTVQNSTNLDVADMTVTITEFCECSDGSSVDCSGTCVSGDVRGYMQISASYDYSPFILPGTMTLTGESTIRTQ